MRDRQELDYRQSIENLEIIELTTTEENKLNLTIHNNGAILSNLIFIGIHDESSGSHSYYDIDYNIEPGEIMSNIRNDSIIIPDGEERKVQLITKLGNILSFNYPYSPLMGTGDGEPESSTVKITGIGLPHRPSNWILIDSTEYVSGSVSDLDENDGDYMVFRSYSSGNITNIEDFVDSDSSDVDSSSDKGSHSIFPAQQSGPNSVFDSIIEETLVSVWNITLINNTSFEISQSWPPTGWSETGNWNREADQAYDGSYSADFDGFGGGRSGNLDSLTMDTSDANAIFIDFWYRDEFCDAGELLLQYFDGNSWDTIIDLSSTAMESQWLHYQENLTDPQYFKSNFEIRWSAVDIEGGETFYIDLVNVKKGTSGQNCELDLEVQWNNVNFSESNEELCIYLGDPPKNTHSLDATGGYMIVGDGTADWGTSNGTISFWVKWDTLANRLWGQHQDMEIRITGPNIIVDWGGTNTLTSNTNFVPDLWYFIAIAWNENSNDLFLYVGDENNPPTLDISDPGWTGAVSSLGSTENNFMASRGGFDPLDGHGDDLRFWNIDRSLDQIQSDYMTELSGSETNLKSYFKFNNDFNDIGPNNDDGSGAGSTLFSSDVPFGSKEDLQMDVWYGGSWQNLFTNLTSGWNNVSVSSYLISPTFTIRFKGADEVGDSNQDSWDIDVSLLHVWSSSNRFTAEIEFTGDSNLEPWTELEWQIDSSWDINSVPVTIQFYNYSKSDWTEGGYGYHSYTSDLTPDTDEMIKQVITSNPTNFRNSTGHWKVRIKGEKNAGTQFETNIDAIILKPIYPAAGSNIEFDTWHEYRIEAVTADGAPLSYGIASIFGNGTSLSLRDSSTKNPINNPDWIYLNINGRYLLELKSTNELSETFYLKTVVGSIIDEKTIVQLPP